MKKSSRSSSSSSTVDTLRSSPVNNLQAIYPQPVEIDIDLITIDSTNPGSLTESLRYTRRAPSIRDSYDILSQIVYPVIICEDPDNSGRYIHIDGFGRMAEARARGQKKIRAIVFRAMTLEERICLRQTLGAAQEPFDAASIIRDLQQLAKERNLDISDPEQIKTLVPDLPEKVRKHERDLVMLSHWHPSAIEALGETYSKNGQAIGLDKIRGMDRILRVLEKRHPNTVAKLGGSLEVSLRLAKMYLAKKFSEGARSQEAVRKVAKTFEAMPQDDPAVFDFVSKQCSHSELPLITSAVGSDDKQLIAACKQLTSLLLEVPSEALTPGARRALQRTDAVLDEVLGSAVA